MKKFSVLFLLLAVLAVGSTILVPVKNAVFVNSEVSFDQPTAGQAPSDVSVSAKSAYLIDFHTGTVLFEQNANAHYPIASMCKIMTLLEIFRHIDRGGMNYNDMVTVSEHAANMGGSQVFLDAKASYLVDDLIKSIVIASANDSCVAIAEHILGSTDRFVARMNENAKALQMNDTNFVNCTGLPSPGQYSSARDTTVMMRELLKYPAYYRYTGIWTEQLKHPSGRETVMTNTNKLVRFFDGCDSGKTGYTAEAGHCLSASAVKNGMRVISTVLGEPDSKTRFLDVSNLFRYAFSHYTNQCVINENDCLDSPLSVVSGKQKQITIKPERSCFLLKKIGEDNDDIRVHYELPSSVKAPIKQGMVVGKLYVTNKGSVVDEMNIIAMQSVDVCSLWDILQEMIAKFRLVG